MPARDVAPDEWECRVFIAVAEERTFAAAAAALVAQTGRAYGPRSVGKVIAKIEQWLGAPAFEERLRHKQTTQRGELFLHTARTIVDAYQTLRDPARTSDIPTLACMPHHLHFVKRAEAALRRRHTAGKRDLNVEFLDRAASVGQAYTQHAVGRLRADVYQLIVGRPMTGEPALVSKDLYEARLEAMVPRSHPDDAISLTDLVQRYRLFLPPIGSRSRRLFEDKIVEYRVPDPRKESRTARESTETATSVLRARNAGANGDNDVVVAPSDVALAFKEPWEFGGPPGAGFRWIPIFHTDEAGTRHLLKQRVSVTMKRTASAGLFFIVDALRRAVAQFPDLAGPSLG
jgi:DNA-binding transcriptional LysR family regulator